MCLTRVWRQVTGLVRFQLSGWEVVWFLAADEQERHEERWLGLYFSSFCVSVYNITANVTHCLIAVQMDHIWLDAPTLLPDINAILGLLFMSQGTVVCTTKPLISKRTCICSSEGYRRYKSERSVFHVTTLWHHCYCFVCHILFRLAFESHISTKTTRVNVWCFRVWCKVQLLKTRSSWQSITAYQWCNRTNLKEMKLYINLILEMPKVSLMLI